MPRSQPRGSKKSVRPDPRRHSAESLAERVFVEAPRTFSFSHRQPGSLRHPYLPLVAEQMETMPPQKRMEYLLEALQDGKSEAEKWNRVGAVFDVKMEAAELDKMRMQILTSTDVLSKVEALWNLLGCSHGSHLSSEAYHQLHTRLYAIVLNCDDVSLTTATITAVNEDFTYDASSYAGVSFGSFGLSMLELADNWTLSRKPADYAEFLQALVNALQPRAVKSSRIPEDPTQVSLSENVFFSGGVLVKHQTENHVQYTKAPM